MMTLPSVSQPALPAGFKNPHNGSNSSRHTSASVASSHLQSDQVHFGSDHVEQPTFTPQAPKREWFFQRWFNQIGRFFKYIGKAIRALFGMEPPKPIHKIIGKKLGESIEMVGNHPRVQEVMSGQTQADWNALLANPRVREHPELLLPFPPENPHLDTPEGRQAYFGNYLQGVLLSSQTEHVLQNLPRSISLQLLLNAYRAKQEMMPVPVVVRGYPNRRSHRGSHGRTSGASDAVLRRALDEALEGLGSSRSASNSRG
jgi:hypothetical protein